ncbi:MAG TPA: hypothetical protein VGQ02_02730 [Candidatus Limnocylindrales bacterium]|jgi:hypothetical protein|nr:hypothetical protein [Candidatus Limnocylindrales bacterium]
MRGRSLCVGTWLLVSVVLGCTPAPSPSPSITPPPTPADFVPWPDIVWRVADLPFRPPGPSVERVVAVTATDDSFVAVGYRETGAVRDGSIWWSIDGDAWELVDDPIFAGVELVDVSPAPGGLVTLGVASVDRPQAVLFHSTDARAWDRLAVPPGGVDTYPSSLAGDDAAVLAAGSAADGSAAVWRSLDGRSFERLTLSGAASDADVTPRVVAGGYVALGSAGGPPILLRSTDGASWSQAPIDQAPDVRGMRLVVGRWGLVTQGIWAPGCGPMASCGGQSIAWWSGDGTVWGRLPGEGSPISNGASTIVPAGEHGLLAIDGANAWSSPDGWAWRPLPEPGDGSIVIDHAVVRGDVIVAVGAEYGEDGSSVGRILVAK